jgi:phage terminase Nu1 subunit (DNA packaging protein)
MSTNDLDRLVDLAGIAELLGVAPVTPQQWRQRGQLPDPDEPFPDKPLWKTSTIIAWARKTKRWPPGTAARPLMQGRRRGSRASA